MPYTIPFAQLNKSDIPRAGGKGANLGEMTAAGFPVPAGFVLTTAAYDAFVRANGLQAQIVELAQSVAADDPGSAQVASEQIRALFAQGAMGEELAAEITDAYGQLTQTSAGVCTADAVAVRSSATAEDLPTASFAGQQDTFLNIQNGEALLAAVAKCWASLWTARALAYRQRQGIDPTTVSLAVVVQVLIPAEASGILFTANPVTGERGEILINATWGLGEAIVGGLVTPDTVLVDRSTWQIVARETAAKSTMTVRTETGTAEQAVPAAQQNQPVLDDTTALALARLGARIEEHYGMPMDIEWAIADDKIAILQARPITALPPAPLVDVAWEPPFPKTIWMRRQIVEHMPEPLSPLFEDLYVQWGLEHSIKELIDQMGGLANVQFDLDKMIPHGFADTINGYAYTTGSMKMDAQSTWALIVVYPRIFKMFNMPAFDWERGVLPRYQALIAHWDGIDRTTAKDELLLQGIREMAIADSAYWWGSALSLGLSRILDPVFDKLLKSVFRAAVPKPGLGSSAFLRGFDSKALDAQAHMEAIADTIRGNEPLRRTVLRTQAHQLPSTLAAHPNGQPVLESIERYLAAYGHQIYNLDFAVPTQGEDPLPLFLSLKALVEKPPAEAVRVRQAKMARERDALIEQTMAALNPLSRWLFGWVWKQTKKYAPYRESVMFYMGGAWPTVRKLAAALGQRLTEAGAIAAPDDIYYLNSQEITAAIEARGRGGNVPSFVETAQERRALRESRKLLTPPAKVPERSVIQLGPIKLSLFDPTPSGAVNEGAVLNGYAVSTGRVTAPASVIRSSDDFSLMQPGTILVCTTTTPAWTPLFSQAVGLVTDVGGALAHGSIVAREYGIPAVMGTGVATERIKSGMLLAVDGDAGTVTLLDEVDANAAAQTPPAQRADKEAAKSRKTLLAVAAGALVVLLFWWKKRKGAKGR
jgi:phosphohistidine swiveling domain-containing protein